MAQGIICSKCGNAIDLTDILKNELDTAVEEKTLLLTKQLEILNKTLKTYMEEASQAKAKVVELEVQLSNVDNLVLSKARQQTALEVAKVKEQLRIESTLKVQEKADTIKQLQKQLVIMQQKVEQGSMQQQGEVQEVYIEEYLRNTFPLDTINEVKKGVNGADVIQVINTRNKLNIGSIYYESKRTKAFNSNWINKLKKDMLEKGSDIGIIVSSARPAGQKRAVNIKGIWVCSVSEFKIISKIIRDNLLKVAEVKYFHTFKEDKKELIYNYITSEEFKLQIETIIEGFSKLQEDLLAEKRAMQNIWKIREKHIQMVIDSTIGFYGSVKGIGKEEIPLVNKLELK